jgi:hypothetical protein
LLLLRHVVRDADYSHGALAVPVRDGGFLAVVDQADCLACFPTAAAFGAHDLGLRRIGHADERNRRNYVSHTASSAIKDRSHFVKSPSENGGSTNLFTGLLYHGAIDDCTFANYNLEDNGSRWMRADASRVIGTPTGHRPEMVAAAIGRAIKFTDEFASYWRRNNPYKGGWARPMNKGGQKTGLQRGDRTRFPYEPRVIGGKLVMPAELQRIHRIILDAAEVEIISDEMRAMVESLWPELAHKLPHKYI